MEMEFKDSSRRRTLVLVVVGVPAGHLRPVGAAAFMLSSQGARGAGGSPDTATSWWPPRSPCAARDDDQMP